MLTEKVPEAVELQDIVALVEMAELVPIMAIVAVVEVEGGVHLLEQIIK